MVDDITHPAKLANVIIDTVVDTVEAPFKIADDIWTGTKDLFTGDFKGFGEAFLNGVSDTFEPLVGPELDALQLDPEL